MVRVLLCSTYDVVFLVLQLSLPHGAVGWSAVCSCSISWPRGYKTFFVFNSTEYILCNAHNN